MPTRLRSALVASVACVALMTSGCATFAAVVGASPSRDEEASELIAWVQALDEVDAADLVYSAPTVQREDTVSGTITLAAGADVASTLDAVRVEYARRLPGAEPMHLDVDAGLPTGFTVALDEDGPDAAALDAALAASDAVSEIALEAILVVRSDGLELTARAPSTTAASAVDTAIALSTALESVEPASIGVYSGQAALAAPQQGQPLDGGSLVVVASPLGAGTPVLDATTALLEASPDASLELQLASSCWGTADLDEDDEGDESVLAAADAWLESVTSACRDGRFEVRIGDTTLTP